MQTFSINYLNKMAEEVRREGLDAILIAPSEDLLFITGHNPIFCERFQGLFVKADGEYFYVCNLLTKDEMRPFCRTKRSMPGLTATVFRLLSGRRWRKTV